MSERLPMKQIMKMVKSHTFASICIFFIELMAVTVVHGTKVGGAIFTVVAILIYASVIYSEAYDAAKRDKKSYTPQKPYLMKGFLLPVGILVLSAVFYAAYFVAWNGHINTIIGFIGNLIFRIWISGFKGITGLNEAYMVWYGYLAVMLLPSLVSGIGYIAGLKDFDLKAKFSKFIYESKEDENE